MSFKLKWQREKSHMTTRKISSIRDLPANFSLARYNGLKRFTLTEWANVFSGRNHMWWLESDQRAIALRGQEHPIDHLNIEGIPDRFSEELFDAPLDAIWCGESNALPEDESNELTTGSVCAAPLYYLNVDYFNEIGRHFPGSKEDFFEMGNSEDQRSFLCTPIDLLRFKCGHGHQEITTLIDLGSSDEKILSDLSRLLPRLRKTLNMPAPRKAFSEADIKQWQDMAIVPYLDLMLWAKRYEVSIPQHVIGEALFPNGEVDTTERIRRTTIPLAKKLMQETTIMAMQQQATLG